MDNEPLCLVALIIEAFLVSCLLLLILSWLVTGRIPQLELSQGLWITYIPVMQPYLNLWLTMLHP